MSGLIGPTFDATDAKKIATWLGHPCPYNKPVPDPTCSTGDACVLIIV
jgi:hypothetical protein